MLAPGFRPVYTLSSAKNMSTEQTKNEIKEHEAWAQKPKSGAFQELQSILRHVGRSDERCRMGLDYSLERYLNEA